MKLLVTGGAGFIGSHTCIALLESNHEVVIIDSHINSSIETINSIKKILNKWSNHQDINLNGIVGDIRDEELLNKLFFKAETEGKPFDAVLHFAGLKSVNESVISPLEYWDSNIKGSISLLKSMNKYNCKTIIFSSSASIYGTNNEVLFKETSQIKPINPYGRTKHTIEIILNDLFASAPDEWKIANLRYFNPIGAHQSGIIGESPLGIPNNIFPLITKVAEGKSNYFSIYGNDWPTKDGTGVRDYIHVMDLAEGHLAALNFLKENETQIININLGTGLGTSVLELINQFQDANNIRIPYEFTNRRLGDAASVIADNSLAINLLNWLPKRSLKQMCIDGWRSKQFGLNQKTLLD